MRNPIKASLIVLALAGAATAAWAGDDRNTGLEELAGKRLVALDGSTLLLTGGDGVMTRKLTAPDGSMQQTAFLFLDDTLGTVADAREPSKTIAVFHGAPGGLDAQFADGHTETLTANAAGGVSLILHAPGGGSTCMAWYPEGHTFSDAERQAAVAEYANRLGVAVPVKAAANPACETVAAKPSAKTEAAPVAPPQASAKPSPRLARLAKLHAIGTPLATAETQAAEAAPMMVRTSEVHPIDGAKRDRRAAAFPPPDDSVASTEDIDGGDRSEGASDCLTVRSDGAHWGFRNRCDYPVQFVYCLKGGGDALTACENGSVPGSVPARSFAALLADRTLSETDAEHGFRWVGCAGGAGEVVPRLDRTSPPEGRCIRGNAS